MRKQELVFKILGLVVTIGFSIAALVVDMKRKATITEADKDAIAERVAAKIKPAKAPAKKVEEPKLV